MHNSDFLRDPLFIESYRLGKQTGSWGSVDPYWRAYIVCWAASNAAHLDGDFVECGVNKGGYARAIMHYTDFPSLGKTFYLLDTFRGLSEKYLSEAEKHREDRRHLLTAYDESYEAVRETFRGFPVAIIRGTVPETLPLVKAERVAFLSIDMNNALPEVAAAEFFWDRLVSGGVIVHDDYGFAPCIEQKFALDQFARERDVRVLALPTGQGLIFKP